MSGGIDTVSTDNTQLIRKKLPLISNPSERMLEAKLQVNQYYEKEDQFTRYLNSHIYNNEKYEYMYNSRV
jgi:hypothetical protein